MASPCRKRFRADRTGSQPNSRRPKVRRARSGAQPVLRFAVNGPAAESDLALLDRAGLEERLGAPGEKGRWRWIGPGESISLEGAQIRGRDYWKTLIMIVLCGLVLEMLVLAWPAVKQNWTSAAGNDSPEQAKERARMTNTGFSLMDQITRALGWALGYEDVSQIESWRITFGAEWAQTGPAWVLFGCLLFGWLAFFFYRRYQRHGNTKARMFLAGLRGALLCGLFVILADPILEIQLVNHPKPVLWVLFDGTDSMAIEDKLPEQQQRELAKSVSLETPPNNSASSGSAKKPIHASRMDYVRAMVQKKEDNLLENLAKEYRLRGYVLDRADGVRAISLGQQEDDFAREKTLPELTTEGQVTALGTAFEDLALRHQTGNLAGLLVVSDFNRNAGPLPEEAAKKLQVPDLRRGRRGEDRGRSGPRSSRSPGQNEKGRGVFAGGHIKTPGFTGRNRPRPADGPQDRRRGKNRTDPRRRERRDARRQ